jgi:hypothetical protein
MGKSSSKSAPPPPVQQPEPVDINAIMAPMMESMQQMMIMASQNNSANQPQMDTPPPPAMPEPSSIDWVKKQEELQKQMADSSKQDLAKKRGRSSTVLTSPLVDEEELSTVAAKPTGS